MEIYKEKRVQRIVSSFLVIAMVLGLTPIKVFAIEKEHMPRFEVKRADENYYAGRSDEELNETYEIWRDDRGNVQYIKFSQESMPTSEEIEHLIGQNKFYSDEAKANERMYRYLQEKYGIAEIQVDYAISQHENESVFLDNLKRLETTREKYDLMPEIDNTLLDLILSGFSSSEAVTAVITSYAFDIEINDIKEAKMKSKIQDAGEDDPKYFDDTFTEEIDTAAIELLATIDKQLGTNIVKALTRNTTVQDYKSDYDTARTTLFPIKNSRTVQDKVSATEKHTRVLSTNECDLEDIIGEPYTYVKNGLVSVATNTGDYTYTETDLSIPGVNGLDLNLERQFASVTANTVFPYGKINNGYEYEDVFKIEYEIYEAVGYGGLHLIEDELNQYRFKGPYPVDEYTFDTSEWIVDEIEYVEYFTGDEFNDAVDELKYHNYYVLLATDLNGDYLYVVAKPVIVGIDPSFEEACENRIREYSYTTDMFNLGAGWRFNFPMVEEYRAKRFQGEYQSDEPTYKHRLILPDGSRYEIKEDDGYYFLDKYPFEDLTIDYISGEYRLEYLNGRTVYFNSDGLMTCMEDAFGNEITIEYMNDTDFTIEDTVGNIITYTSVPVSGDTYYEGRSLSSWLYNVKNVLKLNGQLIRTYYSYYDEENLVQYLKFVVNELDEVTQYESTERNAVFNTFSVSYGNDSNDSKNYTVLLDEINYPDGMSTRFHYSKKTRKVGDNGRTKYYALSYIENYDTVTGEYHSDTGYSYGDFDGIYNPEFNYKTVITEYYAGIIEDEFYEIEKNGTVQHFDSTHKCTRELLFSYQPLQYDEDFSSISDVEDWIDENYCYVQQQVYNHYEVDIPYPSIIRTVSYTGGAIGAEKIEEFYYNEYGQLVEQYNANGEGIYYSYDSSYGLLETTSYYQDDSTEIVIENTLTENDRKIGMTEVTSDGTLESKTKYYYDAYGNLIEQRDYTSETAYSETQYSYTNNAWISQVKTIGVTDAEGYLVTGSPGYSSGTIVERTTYNNRGWPITTTDAKGNITSYSYNALGQITRVQYPDGSQQAVVYDTEERTVTITDQLGTVTRNTYDGSGNLREVYDVTNGTVLQRYDYAYGRLSESTLYGMDSPNQTQYYYYDTLDRVIEAGYLSTSGSRVYYETTEYYDGDYMVVKTLDGDSHAPNREETSYYDEMGNVVETEILYDEDEGDYEYNQYQYDYLGNCISSSLWYSAEGGISEENRYEYDYTGNVIEYTDAEDNVTDYEYDWNGNLLVVNDPHGYETFYTYDALNRLVKVEQPFAEIGSRLYYAVTEYEYDANGNLIVERIRNEEPGQLESTRVTEYEYDSMNRLVTAITYDPDPNYTQYRYDAAGNLLEVYTGLSSKLSFTSYGTPSGSDMNYSVTSYEYDNRSNMIEMTDALGQRETYDYDKNGTLTSKTDRNGNTTEYTYNNMGQPKYVDVYDVNGALTDTLSYTYTDNGLVRRIRTDDYTTYYDYDVFGRVIEEDTGDTVIYNTYDLLGNRMNREVYQGAECISDVSYDYDGNGRMISVNDSGYVADYWYDGLGNCIEACYDGTVTEYRTYNLAGYPESITHKRNTRTLYSFDYVYSVDGNMVEKHDDEGRSTYYTYDDMNRLIREVEELDGDVVQTYEYEFDDFSNRTELYAYGDEDYTINYWYDANNRLLESEKDDGYTETVTEYSYDDNGNQVEKEVWIDNSFDSSETSVYNGFNQLVSVSNDYADTTYTYGPSGLRLTKTVDNEQIYYINDGDNVIAELYDDEVTAYYLRGRNLYGSFIGNDEYFYLYNAHGDVVNLTDTSGYIEHTYRYDAFGNEREPESSDSNPFRYCGEYYDGETGSYYLRARYYDPVVGRFTQQDSYRGDTTDPLSLNYYVYCASNPLAYHDPSGNYWETAFDIASFGLSLKDFLDDPSLFNAGYLLWDTIALAAPVPGSYAGKALGLVNDTDNVSDVFKLIRNVDADAMNDIAQTTTKHGDFSNLSGNLSGQINKSSKAYTKNNFRTNLKKLTNQTGVGMQAHHVFPQKFETEFQRAGIMIHDPKYGSWVETLDHQKWSNAYNKSWEEFFKSTVTPTEQQIYQKARDLAKQYNFTLNFK